MTVISMGFGMDGSSTAVTIAKYSLLALALMGLWFVPTFIHLRDSYRPYDEVLVIPPTGKNFVEREYSVYRWETDLHLFGKFVVRGSGEIILYVMDWDSYERWIRGEEYEAVYISNLVSSRTFNVPLPPVTSGEPKYVLVFQNPGDQAVEITHESGIDFERAFMGISITEWVSRAGIASLAVVVIIAKLTSLREEHESIEIARSLRCQD